MAEQNKKADGISTKIDSIVEKSVAQQLKLQFMEIKSALHEVNFIHEFNFTEFFSFFILKIFENFLKFFRIEILKFFKNF